MDIVIESPRLLFLSFVIDDNKLLLDLETNPEAREFFGGIASADAVKSMLNIFINSFNQNGFSYFKVYTKKEHLFIGAAGFDKHKITNEIGIGYIFYKEYWLNQYPEEAIKALLDWGYKNIKAKYLISVVHENNEVAKNALNKNGFNIDCKTMFDNIPCLYYRFTLLK
jgi:RimJ/RimL family protein N-acetyltransferase